MPGYWLLFNPMLTFWIQIIDGFLAVLNVTGGSFSPPTQKLPFAVTSIDEDSSLLYYSSIDLAGRSTANNSKSPKLQRSFSNNDSRAAKSRLHIPAKGRIQLVLYWLLLIQNIKVALDLLFWVKCLFDVENSCFFKIVRDNNAKIIGRYSFGKV